jgi:hypothetical protein
MSGGTSKPTRHADLWPDAAGHFGPYGGRYVPETLMEPLRELEAAWRAARRDPGFEVELETTSDARHRSASRRGSPSGSPAACG